MSQTKTQIQKPQTQTQRKPHTPQPMDVYQKNRKELFGEIKMPDNQLNTSEIQKLYQGQESLAQLLDEIRNETRDAHSNTVDELKNTETNITGNLMDEFANNTSIMRKGYRKSNTKCPEWV